MLFAHGEVERISLPIPSWLTVTLALLTVALPFAIGANRHETLVGVALPRPVRAMCDSRIARVMLRVIGLLAFETFLIEAWLGHSAVSSNPATTWFYVWFWVGLVPISLFFGNIYRYVNPLRTLAMLLSGLSRKTRRPELLDRIGYWPAVAGLLIYLLLDSVSQEGDWPRVIAGFVSAYAAFHVAAGAWFGPQWFDRCDTFAVYFSLLARLSPIGRRNDGTSIIRSPLTTLRVQPTDHALITFAVALMGAATLNGFTHFSFWPSVDLRINPSDGDPLQSIALGMLILMAASLALCTIYAATTWAIRQFMQSKQPHAFIAFAPVLIPLMAGYAVSTYLPTALFESQAGYLLATGGGATNYAFISTTTIAVLQLIAIMIASVLAAIAARTIAAETLKPQLLRLGQLPLAAMIISYSLIGIAIVSG